MTSFTADADLGKACREAIPVRVIVLANAGRMAFSAHEIPVLVQFGPVQRVAMRHRAVGIEVKPALAALLFWPRIPRNGERLHPSVRKLDQILLQRINTKSVLHLEGRQLAIRPVGLNKELVAGAEEARTHPVVVERRIVEVPAHRFFGGVIHRVAMLGSLPELAFALMATGAGLAADECRL